MRTFVAINPTTKERERLERGARRLKEASFPVRWVRPEYVHLTLKFLGEIPESQLAEVASEIDRVVSNVNPFQLVAAGFGAFPSPRRPQVLWIGVEASSTLRSIQRQVEHSMEELGFQGEKRSYHPHLTLGRVRRNTSASDFRGLEELMRDLDYEDMFQVRCIDVMQSRLTSSGALYDVLHSAGLGS